MATNSVYASFSEVYDLHTEVDKPTVIGVHTPQLNIVQQMLRGFFMQYRKFKYLGCDLTFIPVSTLPADPLQVSYEGGEPTIDPRDMVNPILYKGCHGNSLGSVLDALLPDGLTGSTLGASVDRQQGSETTGVEVTSEDLVTLYYQGLSSPEWGKAHVQRGFRKSNLYPLVYNMSTDTPINNRDVLMGNPDELTSLSGSYAPVGSPPPSRVGDGMVFGTTGVGRQFTSRCSRLGWLDTYLPTRTSAPVAESTVENTQNFAGIPKLMMMCILMPPAYKTEFYFRMVIRHKIAFKNFGMAVGPGAAYFGAANPDGGYNSPLPEWNDYPAAAGASVQSDSVEMNTGSVTLASAGVM